MVKLNENFKNLKESYLFKEVARRFKEYSAAHPEKRVIKMSIGDVTEPLAKTVVEAMEKASAEMGVKETFRGYDDDLGYPFFKDAIKKYYRDELGVTLDASEIFISDGAKSDVANVTDLFDDSNTVLVPDPVYPVYLDTNIMRGRKIVLLPGNSENGFLPLPNKNLKGDIVYLCSPNNPTGAVYTKEQLKLWVDWAIAEKAIILFDSAYESFISDKELPRSIFAVEGAKKCAIEFCSLSKTAGFTGTRCGYTVVPNELVFDGVNLNKMWNRRQSTKFNGVGYVVQRAAEAVFSEEGLKEIRATISYYKENARIISDTMNELGIWFTGGVNSPYIWLKCPDGMKSWEFFDKLLNEAQVIGTPGSGFGDCGEGYLRLTAFNTKENTVEAMERLKKLF